MKQFFLATSIVAIIIVSGCSWFGQPEAYRSEPGRTTFRSAEESPSETATPASQKIPGEKR